jgi:hypothetical protein
VNQQSAASIQSRSRSRWTKVIAAATGVLLLFLVLLGMYWSPMPKLFWVNEYVDDQRTVVGYSTTDTLIRVAETLLDKRGGYLSNDLMPPGVWLDNMPTWEYGVLTQIRDLARVTRNDYSRSQSQSAEDTDLAVAEPKFFFRSYRDRLTGAKSPEAQFYARADSLREWLAQVEKRLGSMSRRLGNSVAADVINEGLAGDPSAEAAQSQPDIIDVRTPWLQLDDVFFEARGTAWALLHFFRAIEFDFSQVLADKNAEASVRQIIRELEASLEPMRWPVVLNGGGYGLTANHSLVMANYLARANAAVINLRELLDQG